MDKFSELVTTLCSDLNIPSTGSSQFPITTVRLAINRAYYRAGGLFRWPETEDAQMRDSQADQEYYDYPTYWRPDSMFRLEIDGELYGEDPDGSPLDFNDFRTWKLNYPDSIEKKWATQWRRFFVSPIPSSVGTNNIKAWGQKAVDRLVNDTDTTIFSYHMRECNDAVIEEAKAILRGKGEDHDTGEMASQKAKEILSIAYRKIMEEKAKTEKNQPFFHVTDMYGKTNIQQITGNF